MEMPVIGSEIFDYPVNSAEVIREKTSPKLKLHTVSEETLKGIDPVTYEVLRHRIWAITDVETIRKKRIVGYLRELKFMIRMDCLSYLQVQ